MCTHTRLRERTPAYARGCTLMMLMMNAITLHAGPARRGGASRCTWGLGLSRGSPHKRMESRRGSCLQAVPLNLEDLREFWNTTAQGCRNSQDVTTLLRDHPAMAERIRATPDTVLFEVSVLYTALRMGHPNVGPLEVESGEDAMEGTYQGGYQDYQVYQTYQDKVREQAEQQRDATHDMHTGEPLTAEGVMWMGAQAFAELRRTHEELKLRPTPPSDLRLPEGYPEVTGVGQPKEGIESVTLPDGTVIPSAEGDLLDAMEAQKKCIRWLEDQIRVKGLGCHPRAKPALYFLECYHLKLSHKLMQIIWEQMQEGSRVSAEPMRSEPRDSAEQATARGPPELRVHPALDATASMEAAADVRGYRIKKVKQTLIHMQPPTTVQAATRAHDQTTERARFTPASLAPLISTSRERRKTGERAPTPQRVTPNVPTANPYSPLVTPGDWEDEAEAMATGPAAGMSALSPDPHPAGAELTTPPAPTTETKRYEHVDIAHALITNRFNTSRVPADTVAMQFGETISEQEEVPGMADVLTAVCLAFDRATGKPDETGPFMVAAPQRAIVIGAEMETFTIWLEDGESAQFSIKPCDGNGRLLLTTRSTYASSSYASQELNVTIVLNLPRWCLGRSLKLGHLDFVKDTVNDALNTFAPGIKTNITQAETAEMGMTKGSLFLFFYPKNGDEYEVVKTTMRAFKRFPVVLDGKEVEPVRAFVPKDSLERLGLRRCCYRPPEECDEEKREDGVTQDFQCLWVKRCDEQMGFAETERRGPAAAQATISPTLQRKRDRDGANKAKEANRASIQARRIQGIKSTLCTKFAAGEVRTRPPACNQTHGTRLTHIQPCAVRSAVRDCTGGVPTPPQRETGLDEAAHRVPVRQGETMHICDGSLPIREACGPGRAHAALDATDAPPTRPGGDRAEARGEGGERIPMQTRSRAGRRHGKRGAQQSRDAQSEREDVRVRSVRRFSGLDECVQTSSRAGEHEHRARRRMHLESMLHSRGQTLQGTHPRGAPDRETRGFSVGDAHACASPAGHGQHDSSRGGRAESGQDSTPCLQGTPQSDLRDGGRQRPPKVSRIDTQRRTPYHWHTRNILWIRGRLPWIIPGRHA